MGVKLVAWFRVFDVTKIVTSRVIMLIHDIGLV